MSPVCVRKCAKSVQECGRDPAPALSVPTKPECSGEAPQVRSRAHMHTQMCNTRTRIYCTRTHTFHRHTQTHMRTHMQRAPCGLCSAAAARR